MVEQVLQNFHMLSTWCLLRGLSTILHLGPAGAVPDRGKEFLAPAGLGPKTKTQTAADVGASMSVTAGAAKSRESAAAAGAGRPATGKM